MDSKVVSKHIRQHIRPTLKAAGFSRFTGRNSWRYREGFIDVINFSSFNAYQAEVLDCTTYSFDIQLGCFSTQIPTNYGWLKPKKKGEELAPKEYDCLFRRRLKPTYNQPSINADYIWHIHETEESIVTAIKDAKSQIENVGFPWFNQFSGLEFMLSILLNEEQNMDELWGFGNNPSPARSFNIGIVAAELNEKALAMEHLQIAIESGCFNEMNTFLKKKLDKY